MTSLHKNSERLNASKIDPPRIPDLVFTLLRALGLRMTLTSPSVPEQWQMTRDGHPCGYVRVRGGHMSVGYPEAGDEQIYEGNVDGVGGFTNHERETRLLLAVGLIAARLVKR